jgi:uncharacterized protein with GYD domain
MLFMYIHTHTPENCIANKPEDLKKMASKMQEDAKKAGIKVIGSYVANHEHTNYVIFEAGDLAALEKGLLPMTLRGTARLIPIITLDQTIAMVG